MVSFATGMVCSPLPLRGSLLGSLLFCCSCGGCESRRGRFARRRSRLEGPVRRTGLDWAWWDCKAAAASSGQWRRVSQVVVFLVVSCGRFVVTEGNVASNPPQIVVSEAHQSLSLKIPSFAGCNPPSLPSYSLQQYRAQKTDQRVRITHSLNRVKQALPCGGMG